MWYYPEVICCAGLVAGTLGLLPRRVWIFVTLATFAVAGVNAWTQGPLTLLWSALGCAQFTCLLYYGHGR